MSVVRRSAVVYSFNVYANDGCYSVRPLNLPPTAVPVPIRNDLFCLLDSMLGSWVIPPGGLVKLSNSQSLVLQPLTARGRHLLFRSAIDHPACVSRAEVHLRLPRGTNEVYTIILSAEKVLPYILFLTSRTHNAKRDPTSKCSTMLALSHLHFNTANALLVIFVALGVLSTAYGLAIIGSTAGQPNCKYRYHMEECGEGTLTEL
jgi:hypothetical protein